ILAHAITLKRYSLMLLTVITLRILHFLHTNFIIIMQFLQSPFRNWLFACFFLSIFSSCELDSQLATLASVAEQDLISEDDDLQDHNDSAHLRMGNIIYEETFEGGKTFAQFIHRQLAGSHSFNTSSSHALDG